jgi:hypothetical protein
MCSLKRSLKQGEIYSTTFVRFSTKSRMHIKGKNFYKSHNLGSAKKTPMTA